MFTKSIQVSNSLIRKYKRTKRTFYIIGQIEGGLWGIISECGVIDIFSTCQSIRPFIDNHMSRPSLSIVKDYILLKLSIGSYPARSTPYWLAQWWAIGFGTSREIQACGGTLLAL